MKKIIFSLLVLMSVNDAINCCDGARPIVLVENVKPLEEQLGDCLHIDYSLDQKSIAAILDRLKPLIENYIHHAMLKKFIALSKINLSKNDVYSTAQEALPIDDAMTAAPE